MNFSCLQTAFILFVLLLSNPFSLPADAEMRLVTGEFAPFAGEDLPHRGLCTWIVEEALAARGQKAQVDFKPWKRGQALVRMHKRLGTFPHVQSSERLQTFAFSDPILEVTAHLFMRSDSPVHYQSEEDLKGLTICLPFGYSPSSFQDLLDRNVVRLSMNRPYTLQGCFNMVQTRADDGLVINSLAGRAVLEKQFPPGIFRMERKPLKTVTYHLMVAKDHPEAASFLAGFNTALAQLMHGGRYDRMLEQYFVESD